MAARRTAGRLATRCRRRLDRSLPRRRRKSTRTDWVCNQAALNELHGPVKDGLQKGGRVPWTAEVHSRPLLNGLRSVFLLSCSTNDLTWHSSKSDSLRFYPTFPDSICLWMSLHARRQNSFAHASALRLHIRMVLGVACRVRALFRPFTWTRDSPLARVSRSPTTKTFENLSRFLCGKVWIPPTYVIMVNCHRRARPCPQTLPIEGPRRVYSGFRGEPKYHVTCQHVRASIERDWDVVWLVERVLRTTKPYFGINLSLSFWQGWPSQASREPRVHSQNLVTCAEGCVA